MSRRAAERAVALDPNLPDARLAISGYNRDVKHDLKAARAAAEEALRLRPGSSTALSAIATLDVAEGQWDSALVHGRQASHLDPRSAQAATRLGDALRRLGRLPEARTELDRGMNLSPTGLGVLEDRAMVELKAGDLDSARAVLRNASSQIEPAALVAFVGNAWDLFWVLDDAQQQLLLTLTPSEFDGDRSTWAIVLAQTYWLRGDKMRARAYADTARIETLALLNVAHEDPQLLLFLGLSQAYLGLKTEALRSAEHGTGILAASPNAGTNPYFQHVLARVYVLCGENDKAVDVLESLLKVPYDLSPGWLRIDPNFAPLKGNPRFEKLIAAK
jgi:serine/threonine-protein kinase